MPDDKDYTKRSNSPEEELKLARERFNIIFQNTTVSIWDYIFETKQIIQPTRSQELHGFDEVIENVPESLVESGFIHPDSAQAFLHMYQKLFAGEPHVEGVFRVQTVDRKGYWYEHIRYKTLFNEDGKPYAAIGISTDDTEEIENRKAVVQWRELLKDALGKKIAVIEFDLTHDVLFNIEGLAEGTKKDWRTFDFNHFMEAYIKDYVHMMDVSSVKNRLQRGRLLADFIDGKYEDVLEYRIQKDDHIYWVRVNTRLMRFETDKSIHFYMLHSDITEQKEQELKLQWKAERDLITGLYNYGTFEERVENLWDKTTDCTNVLVLMDLDDFKEVNDTYGHVEGDQMLHHAARCIENCLEKCEISGISCRAGGDEFAIFFHEETRDQVEPFVQMLLQQLRIPSVDGIQLLASVGIAISPTDGENFERLSMAADRALYYVKHHGKSNYNFYDQIFQSDTDWSRRRQQFLTDHMAGGMLGSYLEDGFPMYFIDDALLHWLGYANESEFNQIANGCIFQAIHLDDRGFVEKSVLQQLKNNGRYTVDYRIRKKDGSYVWVHDVGERVTTKEGREAITAVCYDITMEKEHDKLIQQLVSDGNGAIGLYQFEEGHLLPMYISEGLGELGGFSDEEYMQECHEDAMDSIYEKDRYDVLQVIKDVMKDDGVKTATYRIHKKDGSYAWITGTFSKYGKNDEKPVLRAVYMPLPIQYELQLQTLESDRIGVYVVDQTSKELYYANDTSFRLYGIDITHNYTSKTCHEIYYSCDEVCEDCVIQKARIAENQAITQNYKGRIIQIEVQERVWNNREIAIVYTQDVTKQTLLKEKLMHAVDELTKVEKDLRKNQKIMEARLELEKKRQRNKEENLLYSYVGNISRNEVLEYQMMQDETMIDQEPLTLEEFICHAKQRLINDDDKKKFENRYQRERLLEKYQQGIMQEEYECQYLCGDGKVIWTKHMLRHLQNPATGDCLLYEDVYDISKSWVLNAMINMELGYGYEAIGNLILKENQLTYVQINEKSGKSELKHTNFDEYIRDFAKSYMHPDDIAHYVSHYKQLLTLTKESDHSEVLYRTYDEDGKLHYHKDDNYYYDRVHGIILLTRQEYTDVIQAQEIEKQRLKKALKDAKIANEAKSEFLSKMSHEIRTPMNAILGMSYLVADEVKQESVAAGYIEQINQSSQYLLGILNDILDMSRIENGQSSLNPAWYTSDELIVPILHMMEPAIAQKNILFDYSENVLKQYNVEFYMDKQKTQQMLMNVLNNACKFTPNGGKITLCLKNLMFDQKTGIAKDQITITDTGCGMSEEFLQHIFQPFEQERLPGTEQIPGTGLGLSIARSIAKQMGGDITVKSELGKGSEFTICFKYRYRFAEEAKQKEQDRKEHQWKGLEGLHILLAEDNVINAKIAVALMEKHGIKVDVAENGALAYELFLSSEEDTYDMILLDIQMPVMNGLDTAKNIRNIQRQDAKSIPIIAMSANAYEEDKRLSMEAGMNEHLSKPVDPQVLYQTLQRFVEK